MIRFEGKHFCFSACRLRRNTGASRVALCCLAFFVFACEFSRGIEIDRLIVAVNGVAITEGDLKIARSLNAIIFYGKNTGVASRKEEIERLIDQELMRQELKNFSLSGEEEIDVEARMQSIRDAYASIGGPSALLKRIGLQESELISYVRLESAIMRFVDFRFRPFVAVSAGEIQDYYEKRLTPQLRESKISVPPLEQVLAKIESILKEEKINAVLDQWVKDIRRNSRIEYFDDVK
jgi:hypothetical protein